MIRHDLRYDTGYGYVYDAMYNSRFTILQYVTKRYTIHDLRLTTVRLQSNSRLTTVRYLIDLDSKPNLPKTQEQYTNPISVSNNILSTFQR